MTLPARPDDCSIRSFPNTPPTYRVRDLARIELECPGSVKDLAARQSCRDVARVQACQAGADTVYDEQLMPSHRGMQMKVLAATRTEQANTLCQPACSGGYQCMEGLCVEACEPTCEPGYQCIGGTCKALCHPPCKGEEECNSERRCAVPEPDAGVASDAGVGQDAGVAPNPATAEQVETGK